MPLKTMQPPKSLAATLAIATDALHELEAALRLGLGKDDAFPLPTIDAFDAAMTSLGLTQWTMDVAKLSDPPTLLRRLKTLDTVLSKSQGALSTPVAPLSDVEVVARASGGIVLYGLRLGLPGDSPSKPFLQPPSDTVLVAPTSPPRVGGHWFESASAARDFCAHFATHSRPETDSVPSSPAQRVKAAVHVAYSYVPTASMPLRAESLRLSHDAARDAATVTSPALARAFLAIYGSHVRCGSFELGGVLCKVVEHTFKYLVPSDTVRTAIPAADLSLPYSECSYGWGIDVDTIWLDGLMCERTTRLECTGPRAPSYILFEHQLVADKATWHVIDVPRQLVGVWDVLRKAGYAAAATLVRTAWLALVGTPDVASLLEAAVHTARLDSWLHRPDVGSAVKTMALTDPEAALAAQLARVDAGDDANGTAMLDLMLLLVRCDLELGRACTATTLGLPRMQLALQRFVATHDTDVVARLGGLFDGILDAMLAQATPPVVVDAAVRAALHRSVQVAAVAQSGVADEGAAWTSPIYDVCVVPAAVEAVLRAFEAMALPDLRLLTLRVGALLVGNLMTRSAPLWAIATLYGCTQDGFVSTMSTVHVRSMLGAMHKALENGGKLAADDGAAALVPLPLVPPAALEDDDAQGDVVRLWRDLLVVGARPEKAPSTAVDRLWFALKHQLSVTKELYTETAKPSRPPRRNAITEGPVGVDVLASLLASLSTVARANVYRLLLDRRFLVPLLMSDDCMLLLDAVALGLVETRLDGGATSSLLQNTSVRRIAIVSERPAARSATKNWIQGVFHVDSMSCMDRTFGRGAPAQAVVAELGWGFVQDNTAFTPVMVLHVVGDYMRLAPFLAQFADVLVVDAGSDTVRGTLARGTVLTWRHADDDDDDETVTSTETTRTIALTCPMDASYAAIAYYVLDDMYTKGPRAALASMPPAVRRTDLCAQDAAMAATDFGTLRTKTLVLQRHFVAEAALRIALQRETSAPGRQALRQQLEELEELQNAASHGVRHTPLLQYFVAVLQEPSAARREMQVVALENGLAASYKCLALPTTADWSGVVTGLEHLWREVSHLFAMAPNVHAAYPQYAAQHLVDGFSLELMDGDAGMVNKTWISAVLRCLETTLPKGSRVFVLSALGVQSSGKSTLLNCMFGVRLKTSVARCTRGVSLQLLACDSPMYDYVLLLDTEGIQSPDYTGQDGTVWRDNRIASMAILPADATIVLTKGEATKTINDVLPIVLSAVANSELAAASGGHLPTKLYFVFNQVDVAMTSSLAPSLDALLHSLRASAKQIAVVRQSTATATFFDDVDMSSSSSKGSSDVWYLGLTHGVAEPPMDTPIAAYGECLLQLREHVHQRAATCGQWRARTIDALNKTLTLVWTCLESANFELDFATAHQRMLHNRLQGRMTQHTQSLASIYAAAFETVLQQMSADSVAPVPDDASTRYEALLVRTVHAAVEALDSVVAETLADEAFAKWATSTMEMWADVKRRQRSHSTRLVLAKAQHLFMYDVYAKAYKAQLQAALVDRMARCGASATMNAFDAMFEAVMRRANAEHPALAPSVPQLVCAVLHSYTVFTSDELASDGTPQSGATGWVSRVKHWVRGGEAPTPLESTLGAVRDCVRRCVASTDRYGDDVVLACAQEAKAMLQSMQSTRPHMQAGARALLSCLTTELQAKQAAWDAANSVAAKFDACKPEMRLFADNMCRGQIAADLFVATLHEWLTTNLVRAFAEQVAAVVAAALKHAAWVHSASAMQAVLDQSLLQYLRANDVDTVLMYLQAPAEHTTEVTTRRIRAQVEVCYLDVADKLVRDVKQSILCAAAEAEAASDERSARFLRALRLSLQRHLKRSGTSVMVTSLPAISSGVFDCDDRGPTIFSRDSTTESALSVPATLLDHVDKLAILLQPCSVWSAEMADCALDLIRYEAYGAVDGIVPRCGEPCPWCQCPCTKALGHASKSEDDRLHDAPHQPSGLVGAHVSSTKELYAYSCAQSVVQDRWMNYRGKSSRFKDFEKVFPAWATPHVTVHLPLREYIFANCQDELAQEYNLRKCIDMPASYAHDLGDIERSLEDLLR